MARYRFNPRKSGEWLEAYFFLLFAILPAVSILVNLENGWKDYRLWIEVIYSQFQSS